MQKREMDEISEIDAKIKLLMKQKKEKLRKAKQKRDNLIKKNIGKFGEFLINEIEVDFEDSQMIEALQEYIKLNRDDIIKFIKRDEVADEVPRDEEQGSNEFAESKVDENISLL